MTKIYTFFQSSSSPTEIRYWDIQYMYVEVWHGLVHWAARFGPRHYIYCRGLSCFRIVEGYRFTPRLYTEYWLASRYSEARFSPRLFKEDWFAFRYSEARFSPRLFTEDWFASRYSEVRFSPRLYGGITCSEYSRARFIPRLYTEYCKACFKIFGGQISS